MLVRACVPAAAGAVEIDLWEQRMTTTERLTECDIDEFCRELDRIRDEVIAARGEEDAGYIRRVIAVQRGPPSLNGSSNQPSTATKTSHATAPAPWRFAPA